MSFSGCDTRRARDDCERGACDRHALGVNAERQPTAGAFRLADCERSWRRVQFQRGRDSVARRTAQAFVRHVLRTTAIGHALLVILLIHLTPFRPHFYASKRCRSRHRKAHRPDIRTTLTAIAFSLELVSAVAYPNPRSCCVFGYAVRQAQQGR